MTKTARRPLSYLTIALCLTACGTSQHNTASRNPPVSKWVDIQPAAGSPYTNTYDPNAQSSSLQQDATYASNGQPLDPLKAHEWAKRQVNPRDTSSRRRYTHLTNDDGRTKRYGTTNSRAQTAYTPTLNPSTIPPSVMAQAASSTAPIPSHKPVSMRAGSIPPAPGVEVASLGRITIPAQKPVQYAAPSIKPASAPMPQLGAQRISIENVRIGNHPNKLRVVLDATNQTDASYFFNGTHDVLTITFQDNISWQAPMRNTYANNPIIESYNFEGKDLTIHLRKAANVTAFNVLPPNDVYQTHRVMFDLTP